MRSEMKVKLSESCEDLKGLGIRDLLNLLETTVLGFKKTFSRFEYSELVDLASKWVKDYEDVEAYIVFGQSAYRILRGQNALPCHQCEYDCTCFWD